MIAVPDSASMPSVTAPRLSMRAAPSRDMGSVFRADAPRPGVEIIDMVADVAGVPPEEGTGSLPPHLLKLTRADPEIKGRLLGREERASLPGARRPCNVIVHGFCSLKDVRESGQVRDSRPNESRKFGDAWRFEFKVFRNRALLPLMKITASNSQRVARVFLGYLAFTVDLT